MAASLVARLRVVELAWDIAEVEEPKPLIREHRLYMRRYPNCLTGAELVNWLVVNNRASGSEDARHIAQGLMEHAGLTAVTDKDKAKVDFEGGATNLYHFRAMEALLSAELRSSENGEANGMQQGEQGLARKTGSMFVSPLDEDEGEAGEGGEEPRETSQVMGEERPCTVRLSEGLLSFTGPEGFHGELVLSPTVSVATVNKLPLALVIGNHTTNTNFVFRCSDKDQWNEWMAAILDTKMAMMLMEDGGMNV